MNLAQIRAWALLRIARGDSTGDLELDSAGYCRPLDGSKAQEVAEAGVRGDEDIVTEALPSGLTRPMMESFQ